MAQVGIHPGRFVERDSLAALAEETQLLLDWAGDREDLPLDWVVVGPNVRFRGCAPHEESTFYGPPTERRQSGPAVRCVRCGAVSALVYRDDEFRCREPEECAKTVAMFRRPARRSR